MDILGKVTGLFIVLVTYGVSANDPSSSTPGVDSGSIYALDPSNIYSPSIFLDDVIKLTNLFIGRIQPDHLPYDLLTDLFVDTGGEISKLGWTTILTEQVESNYLEFTICLAVGILFIILMPIIGLIFCCCRCCGKCGGTMVQKPAKRANCTRWLCCFFLLLLVVIMGLASACMFLSNADLQPVPGRIVKVASDGVNDIQLFVRNSANELTDTAVELVSDTGEGARAILDDVASAGEQIERRLLDIAGSPLSQAKSLAKNLNYIGPNLDDLITYLSDSQSSIESLSKELKDQRDILNDGFNKIPNCNEIEHCEYLRDEIGKLKILISSDQVPLEAVRDVRTNLGDVLDPDYLNSVTEGEATLAEISSEVRLQLADGVAEGRAEITTAEEKLLVSLKAELSNATDYVPEDLLTNYTVNFRNSIQKYYDPMENYRWIGFLAVSGLCVLIALFYGLGLLLGVCGFNQSDLPSQRSGASTCGGVFLMVGVGFSFIFASLLMLIVVIFFIVGSFGAVVCRDLGDLTLLAETVDDPASPYFYNFSALYDSPLSVSGMLKDCRDNATVYTALGLEEVLRSAGVVDELDKLIDAVPRNFIDDSEVNINSVAFLNPVEIEKLSNFHYTKFHFADNVDVMSQMGSDVLEVDDFDYFVDELLEIAKLPELPTESKDNINTAANNLAAMTTTSVPKLEILSLNINELIEKLKRNFTWIREQDVPVFMSSLTTAQEDMANELDNIVVEAVQDFKDSFFWFIGSQVDLVYYSLETEVAPCRPLSNVYDSFHVVLCSNVVDSFNVFWFALGAVVASLIPAIVLGVRLAKHFRRMNEDLPASSRAARRSHYPQQRPIPMAEVPPTASRPVYYNPPGPRYDEGPPPPRPRGTTTSVDDYDPGHGSFSDMRLIDEPPPRYTGYHRDQRPYGNDVYPPQMHQSAEIPHAKVASRYPYNRYV